MLEWGYPHSNMSNWRLCLHCAGSFISLIQPRYIGVTDCGTEVRVIWGWHCGYFVAFQRSGGPRCPVWDYYYLRVPCFGSLSKLVYIYQSLRTAVRHCGDFLPSCKVGDLGAQVETIAICGSLTLEVKVGHLISDQWKYAVDTVGPLLCLSLLENAVWYCGGLFAFQRSGGPSVL